MEETETSQMHKYGESKTSRIMMAAVRHVTSSSGLRKFQATWFSVEQRVKHKQKSQYFYEQKCNKKHKNTARTKSIYYTACPG